MLEPPLILKQRVIKLRSARQRRTGRLDLSE
jgi:hypothetical protein